MKVIEVIKPLTVLGDVDVDNYTAEADKAIIQLQNLQNDSWKIYNTHTMTVGAVGYIVYVLYKEN